MTAVAAVVAASVYTNLSTGPVSYRKLGKFRFHTVTNGVGNKKQKNYPDKDKR